MKCLLDVVDIQCKEKLYCPGCVPTEDESCNTNTNNSCSFEKLNDFLQRSKDISLKCKWLIVENRKAAINASGNQQKYTENYGVTSA